MDIKRQTLKENQHSRNDIVVASAVSGFACSDWAIKKISTWKYQWVYTQKAKVHWFFFFFLGKVPGKDCFYNTENFQKVTMNKTVAPLSPLSGEDELETRLLILSVTMFPFFSLGCFERIPSCDLWLHSHLAVWRPLTHTQNVMEATWRAVIRFPSQSLRAKVISSQEGCWET